MAATYDLIVHGGEAVNHDGRGAADIGVRGGKIVAIGLNYADHAAEAGMDLPEEPRPSLGGRAL